MLLVSGGTDYFIVSHESENANCFDEQQNRKNKAVFFVYLMVLQFDRLCLLEPKPCFICGCLT